MSTVLANPAEMIRRGAPRLIRNEEELAEYTSALFDLTAKADRSPEEEEAIELLTLLIDRYESEHYPVPAAEPVEVLRFLLERQIRAGSLMPVRPQPSGRGRQPERLVA